MATNAREVGELTRMVADELRAQRAARRWTQVGMQARTGIKAAQLSRMERGTIAIDMEQLAALATAFDMSPEEFVASARRSAESRRRGDIYREDGALDSERVRGATEPDEHLDEMAGRSDDRAGRRVSTPTT